MITHKRKSSVKTDHLMGLIHHVSENLLLNLGCSQKYIYNEHIHVDNNKIITMEIMREKKGITVNSEDGNDQLLVSF